MTHNQKILAQLQTKVALARMRVGQQPNPTEKLAAALAEAIDDARGRTLAMCAAGGAGTAEHLALDEQIARWNAALRSNR